MLQVAENVRPSSRLLNDRLDFNHYVDVKIIEWKDNSMSQMINGVVMSKNLAHRSMQASLTEPSVLVLKRLNIG